MFCDFKWNLNAVKSVGIDEIFYTSKMWSHKRKNLTFCFCFVIHVSHILIRHTELIFDIYFRKIWVFSFKKCDFRMFKLKEVHGNVTRTLKDNRTTVFIIQPCSMMHDIEWKEGTLHFFGIWCRQLPKHTFFTKFSSNFFVEQWKYLITQRIVKCCLKVEFLTFPWTDSLPNVYSFIKGSTFEYIYSLEEVPTSLTSVKDASIFVGNYWKSYPGVSWKIILNVSYMNK